MKLDLQTLVLIAGVIHLIQMFVFFIQYQSNKSIAGPGWWFLWSAFETIGFFLILLRANLFLLPYIIAFQDIILLSGTIFIYLGILRFFNQYIRLKFIIPFFSSFVILHLFFCFAKDDIEIRSFIFHLYISTIAFLTARVLLRNRTRAILTTILFNATIFILHGTIFAYLSVMIMIGVSFNDPFIPNLYNYLQYADALLAGLLWTFGFIMMLNQKLNIEVLEVKNHFEQIFNTNPDSAVITRLSDSVFVDCNEGYARMSGYSKAEIIGKSSLELNTWKFPADRLEALKILGEKGSFENYEFLFLCKNGEEITGLMSSKILDHKGIPHVISVIRDITERKRIEIKLRESEEKYKALFEANTDGITIFLLTPEGPAGNILDMNDNAAMMLGYKKEEILLLNPNSLEKDLTAEKIAARKLALMSHGNAYFETTLFRRDGHEINVEINASMISYHRRPALMNIVRDITARKKMEAALRESEEKFREMADLLPQIVFESDSCGKLTYVNKHAFKILGYPEDFNIGGLNTLDLYITEDKSRAVENIKRTMSGLKEKGNEYTMIRQDGSLLNVLVYSNPIFKDNHPVGLRGIIVDISDRKIAEMQINLKNEQLQRLNTEKDKFFSIIAHDLRSPFNGFLGLTQIMAEDLPVLTMTELQEIAVSMRNSATNLFRLLENLLQWSRIQQGMLPIIPEELNLVSIVDESIVMVAEQARIKAIEIDYDFTSDFTIFADLNMIQTVFRNLVSNAVKFTNKGGKITISAREIEAQLIEISVVDNGIGMSRQLINNLFRLDVQTNRKGTEGEPSTGLGLLLCKEFVEKHHGTIWVDSKENIGSTFYFTLPLTQKTNQIN